MRRGIGSGGAAKTRPDPIRRSSLTQFDLTQDGIVDGADLGALLGAWGQCPSNCVTCSSAFSMAMSGGDEAAWESLLDVALAILGFASVDEFNVWFEKSDVAEQESVLAQLAAGVPSGAGED